MTKTTGLASAAGAPQSATAALLLDWWDEHRRALPWRAPAGRKPDPYAVWLSEIMLQQTTVASVTGFFHKFILRWPSVEALAAAPLDEVLAEWAGLGYYARARNLHACARRVAGDLRGRFPRREAELLALPGVGPYTAAAIAAIAFDEPCVAPDGNVERVMARLFAVGDPLPRAKAVLKEKARSLLPPHRPGDFAQALMDLGATVCTPRAPNCSRCPLSQDCAARRLNTPLAFPVKAPKAERPLRRGAVFVLRSGDCVLLRRRPEKGLLGAMTEFPSTPLDRDFAALADATGSGALAAVIEFAPAPAPWREVEGAVRHVFTHFALDLKVFSAEIPLQREVSGCRWARTQGLAMEALPTLMRKAATYAGLTPGKRR